MQWYVALTRVIATTLFANPQVHEYGAFHFFVRWLSIRLGVASTLILIRPSTEVKKGVKG